MIIKDAKYLVSSTTIDRCPAPVLPEYAFIGRSNVGKSSLINMLTDRKKLARISKAPGKTRLINHFIINNEWYLVDLPGYGFAKVPAGTRKEWQKMIHDYILRRENLMCLFVLIDSRHKPQKNDIVFMELLGTHQIPFVIVFTKTDKLTNNELRENLLHYKKEMLKVWEALPTTFTTSTTNRRGREEILDFIGAMNLTLK